MWYTADTNGPEHDPITTDAQECDISKATSSIYLSLEYPSNKSVTFQYNRLGIIKGGAYTVPSAFVEKVRSFLKRVYLTQFHKFICAIQANPELLEQPDHVVVGLSR